MCVFVQGGYPLPVWTPLSEAVTFYLLLVVHWLHHLTGFPSFFLLFAVASCSVCFFAFFDPWFQNDTLLVCRLNHWLHDLTYSIIGSNRVVFCSHLLSGQAEVI